MKIIFVSVFTVAAITAAVFARPVDEPQDAQGYRKRSAEPRSPVYYTDYFESFDAFGKADDVIDEVDDVSTYHKRSADPRTPLYESDYSDLYDDIFGVGDEINVEVDDVIDEGD